MSPQNGGACCHDSSNTGNVSELPATRNKSVSGDECLILAGAEETHHGAADVTELEAPHRDLQAALFIHPPHPPEKLYLNQIQSATCDRFYEDLYCACAAASRQLPHTRILKVTPSCKESFTQDLNQHQNMLDSSSNHTPRLPWKRDRTF